MDWASDYTGLKSIMVVNDHTANENRFGARADIQCVIDEVEIDEVLLVLVGDNLSDFELVDLVKYYEDVGADCITTHQLDDLEEIKRTGVIELDKNQKVTSFEEKSENQDAPGNFIL